MTELAQSSSSLYNRAIRKRNTSIENKGSTMYNGMLDFCPSIVVDQSTLVTSLRIRGRNHILEPGTLNQDSKTLVR